MNRDHASEAQIAAADPAHSTWLSANAGSGKTRVLTDRAARLLLRGVSPQNILCLTYTKAAAAEMQNRLFKRLGKWAMKDDVSLADDLHELGLTDVGDLSRARRLFARAIETPGGLKIQTIHSFCAAILRRFPLEAGVSPQFVEMDERAALIMQSDVVEEMADSKDRSLLTDLARFYTGEDLSALTREIAGQRAAFHKPITQQEILPWFDLPPDFDAAALHDIALREADGPLLQSILPLLKAGSVTEQRAADKLAGLRLDRLSVGDLAVLESVFLLGEKAGTPFAAKIDKFPTQGLRKGAAAPFMPDLNSLMQRLEEARPARIGLYSAQKTLALHCFATRFLSAYEARKSRHGWLDFDDLIQKANDLLTDPAVAAWVLYRLDGGIDHVLVDEAQDTSPAQWQVIEKLTQEFTSGKGARSDTERTIFVVGDQKQSIYSFQGADPDEFNTMRDRYAKGLKQVNRALVSQQLSYSFRSAPAILRLVDHCLDGVPGLGDSFKHHAFFSDKPGRVDLWPVVEKTTFEEDRNWNDPVDRPSPENHNIRLAEQVGDEVARLLENETISGEKGPKPVEPKDILVLVRKRSGGLFDGIISACKKRNLPIAGADRLRIGSVLAVKDLTALLKFLATPEDDLSLASVLRSPLFRWSEADLYSLAQGRGPDMYLWRALFDAADTHEETVRILRELRDGADFLRPYDLLDRVLTRYRGRMHLLARLGPEAEDGIDALLAQALAYERLETPSLTGFLIWLEAEEVTIKRQMDSGSNQIRVMTVHGAKGLEAPIVILPDTAKSPVRLRGEITDIGDGRIVWKPSAAEAPEIVQSSLTRQKRREFEEWIRLLYVAMTRAEQWLIIAAAGETGTGQDSWYAMVEDGMREAGAEDRTYAGGFGSRFQTGTWPESEQKGDCDKEGAPPPLPGWATRAAEAVLTPPAPLSPSDLGGPKALPGDVENADIEAAMQRGRQIHRLLEHLPMWPRAQWPKVADTLLSFGEDAAREAELANLMAEVSRVLTAPGLAFLFAPEALAEVDVSASLPALNGRRIHGTIDRLLIGAERVLAIDFKSNALVPEQAEGTPEGLLRQMGAYAAALAEIYPGRRIDTAILWTSRAQLMPLPHDLVSAALRRLDAEHAGS